MKVWLLLEGSKYDGSWPKAVFTDPDKAVEYLKRKVDYLNCKIKRNNRSLRKWAQETGDRFVPAPYYVPVDSSDANVIENWEARDDFIYVEAWNSDPEWKDDLTDECQ